MRMLRCEPKCLIIKIEKQIHKKSIFQENEK